MVCCISLLGNLMQTEPNNWVFSIHLYQLQVHRAAVAARAAVVLVAAAQVAAAQVAAALQEFHGAHTLHYLLA